MSNSVRKEKKKLIIDIVIIVLIAVVTFAVVWILTSSKETVQTTVEEADETDSIVCQISNVTEKDFFDLKDAKAVKQEIKALFTNKKLSKLFYLYEGEYESDSAAERASAIITARFNEYLGKNGVSLNDVTHSIYHIDSNVRADLYVEAKKLNLYTGKVFLLDSNEFNTAKSLAPKNFEKLYKNKGFSCEEKK